MPTITKPVAKKTLQRRQFTDTKVRSINEQTRTVTVIASTDAIDSYGTIIKQSGWDFKRFLENPVVPLSHRWDDLPIGRVTRVEVEGEKLIADIQFAPAEGNEMAEKVWQLWRLGFMRAVSVGFMPIEWHYENHGMDDVLVYDRAELLEISVVTIPANPEALAQKIVRGARSTKAENKQAAEGMIDLLTRMISIEDEKEPDIDEPTADDLPDEDIDEDEGDTSALRLYRKLVPSLRVMFNVDKMDDELEQVQAIRDAIARRDADPTDSEPPQAPTDAETPPSDDTTTDEPVADAGEVVPDDKQEPEPVADEPVADDEDLAAIAEAAIEKIEADDSK